MIVALCKSNVVMTDPTIIYCIGEIIIKANKGYFLYQTDRLQQIHYRWLQIYFEHPHATILLFMLVVRFMNKHKEYFMQSGQLN